MLERCVITAMRPRRLCFIVPDHLSPGLHRSVVPSSPFESSTFAPRTPAPKKALRLTCHRPPPPFCRCQQRCITVHIPPLCNRCGLPGTSLTPNSRGAKFVPAIRGCLQCTLSTMSPPKARLHQTPLFSGCDASASCVCHVPLLRQPAQLQPAASLPPFRLYSSVQDLPAELLPPATATPLQMSSTELHRATPMADGASSGALAWGGALTRRLSALLHIASHTVTPVVTLPSAALTEPVQLQGAPHTGAGAPAPLGAAPVTDRLDVGRVGSGTLAWCNKPSGWGEAIGRAGYASGGSAEAMPAATRRRYASDAGIATPVHAFSPSPPTLWRCGDGALQSPDDLPVVHTLSGQEMVRSPPVDLFFVR